MSRRFFDPALLPILDKVNAGECLRGEEGLSLQASLNLNGLGMMANIARERKNGNLVPMSSTATSTTPIVAY
jgi:hypothetical protein